MIQSWLGKGKGRKEEGIYSLIPFPGREGNDNSGRPRRRKGMKTERLGMKGKEIFELASIIFKIIV